MAANSSSSPKLPVSRLAALLLLAAVVSLAAALGAVGILNKVYDRGIAETDALQKLALLGKQTEVHYKNQVHEWKNILLRGFDGEAYTKYQEDMLAQAKLVSDLTTEAIESAEGTGFDSRDLREFQKQHGVMTSAYIEQLAKNPPPLTVDSARAIDSAVHRIDRAPQKTLDSVVTQIDQFADIRSAATRKEADETFDLARRIAVGAVAIQLLLVGMVMLVVMRQRPS